MSRQTRADYLAARRRRAEAALAAAAALLAGDPAPARRALHAWGLPARPGWADALSAALLAEPPRPGPEALALALAPAPAAPEPAAASPWRHREWLAGLPLPAAARTPERALAWGLIKLSELLEELALRHRAPWLAAPYPAEPLKDAAAAVAWRAWLDGDLARARAAWEALYLEDSRRGLRAVLQGRGVPADRWGPILADHDEALFYRLLGADGGDPGWRELAARVQEAAGAPPASLAAGLGEGGLARAGWCAAHRDHHRTTLTLLAPGLSARPALGRLVSEQLGAPGGADGLVALHLSRRLIERWACGECLDDPAIDRLVRANLGRTRARLRALLAGGDAPLRGLLDLDGLHARTRAASRRYARDWASREHKRGYTWSGGAVDPPCLDQPAGAEPLGAGERGVLRAWLLRCLLQDPRHVDDLERWAWTGGIGRRSGTFSRLLAELPEALLDPPAPGEVYRRRQRVRAALVEELEGLYQELLPHLEALATIDREARDRNRRFQASLREIWRSEVPPMQVRFRSYIDNAGRAAALIQERGGP